MALDHSSAHAVSCRLRLQFPFVFRQLHSLQMLGLARPFPFSFVSSASLHFSGLPLPRPIAASTSLSDPRCFRFLSSASVLGSDYSASVSSFQLSSRFRLTVASSLLLRFFRCLGLSSSFQADFSSLPVDFAYSASLYVSFRSSLFRSHSRSTGASASFRFYPSIR